MSAKNRTVASLCGEKTLKVGRLYKKLNTEMTYHSNSIEGNRLSQAETASILSQQIAGQGKSVPDFLDIVGHAKAWEHDCNLVSTKSSINTDDLLRIHELVLLTHPAGERFRE